jgi:rubrerythrin
MATMAEIGALCKSVADALAAEERRHTEATRQIIESLAEKERSLAKAAAGAIETARAVKEAADAIKA